MKDRRSQADLWKVIRDRQFSPAANGPFCLQGMRVTVGMIVGLVASDHTFEEILAAYRYLEEEDIRQALAYAAWRVEEIEVPLPAA